MTGSGVSDLFWPFLTIVSSSSLTILASNEPSTPNCVRCLKTYPKADCLRMPMLILTRRRTSKRLSLKSFGVVELLKVAVDRVGPLPWFLAMTVDQFLIILALLRPAIEPINVLGYEIPVGADLIFISPTASSMTTKSTEQSIRAYDTVRSETSLKYGLQGKRLWEDDTEEFKPERWIVVDEKTGKMVFDPKAGGSVPFGLGVRSCPGKALAVSSSVYFFIARIIVAD